MDTADPCDMGDNETTGVRTPPMSRANTQTRVTTFEAPSRPSTRNHQHVSYREAMAGSSDMPPIPRRTMSTDVTSSTVVPSAETAGTTASQPPEEANELHAFPPVAAMTFAARRQMTNMSGMTGWTGSTGVPPSTIRTASGGLPPLQNSRQPPRHPVLAPEYRYCQREGFVKPLRTHHCRICCTCEFDEMVWGLDVLSLLTF